MENECEATEPTAEGISGHLLHLHKGYDDSLLLSSYKVDGEEGSQCQNI